MHLQSCLHSLKEQRVWSREAASHLINTQNSISRRIMNNVCLFLQHILLSSYQIEVQLSFPKSFSPVKFSVLKITRHKGHCCGGRAPL